MDDDQFKEEENVLRDTECHDTMFASHVRVKGVVRGSFGLRYMYFSCFVFHGDATSGGPQGGHCDQSVLHPVVPREATVISHSQLWYFRWSLGRPL